MAVRGVRQSIPAGSVVGRKRGSGKGAAQFLSINDIAQQLATGGTGISIQPGGGSGLSSIPDGDVLANISGGSATPVGNTLTAILDHVMGSTEGQILQRGASAWQVLAPGTANQVLTSGGAAALNAWAGLSTTLDAVFGNTEGNILQRGASAWQVLAPGTAGNVLKSGGPGALNSWGSVSPNFNNQGTFNGFLGYNPGDVTQYNAAAYLCYAATGAPATTPAAWDLSQSTNVNLTSTNITNDHATSTGSGKALTSAYQTSGKWYWEENFIFRSNNNSGGGFADQGGHIAIMTYLGGLTDTFVGHGAGGSIGSSIGTSAFCVDIGAGLFWFAQSAASPNWNGTSANPGAGTGGILIGAIVGGLTPYWQGLTSSEQCVLITSPSFITGTVPTGFTLWPQPASSNSTPDLDFNHWISAGVSSVVLDDEFGSTPGAVLFRTPTGWVTSHTGSGDLINHALLGGV